MKARCYFLKRRLLTAIVCSLYTVTALAVIPTAVHAQSDPPAHIFDFTVAQAFLSYSPNPFAAKFVVIFNPLTGFLNVNDIASITVSGPNGYHFAIKNEPFSPESKYNGYDFNPRLNVLWYRAYDTQGFLEDGMYVIDVQFANESSITRQRELTTNYALLEAYVSHYNELTFAPCHDAASPSDDTVLRWTPLAAVGGPDAYYCSWLLGQGIREGDNIYFRLPNGLAPAGFNKYMSRRGTPQSPLPPGDYYWMVEIVDANIFSHINMVIFQPWQHFTCY